MKYPLRGKKELKRLAKRLSNLLEKGLTKKSAQVQHLIYQIKHLLAKQELVKDSFVELLVQQLLF